MKICVDLRNESVNKSVFVLYKALEQIDYDNLEKVIDSSKISENYKKYISVFFDYTINGMNKEYIIKKYNITVKDIIVYINRAIDILNYIIISYYPEYYDLYKTNL